jgi:hypothetical protein
MPHAARHMHHAHHTPHGPDVALQDKVSKPYATPSFTGLPEQLQPPSPKKPEQTPPTHTHTLMLAPSASDPPHTHTP